MINFSISISYSLLTLNTLWLLKFFVDKQFCRNVLISFNFENVLSVDAVITETQRLCLIVQIGFDASFSIYSSEFQMFQVCRIHNALSG